MITAPLPRASPSGTGRLSMIIPRYYGLTITYLYRTSGRLWSSNFDTGIFNVIYLEHEINFLEATHSKD